MAVDIKYLASQGVSAKAYKPIFSAERVEWPRRIRQLIDGVSSEIKDGYTMCLEEWKAYFAIDRAYDIPFAQTTPTLVQHILSKNLNAKDTLEELKKYGLSEETLFLKIQTPDGGYKMQVNIPVFYQIYIPIVKAYLTVRLAKIFNERNTTPLLPFRPIKQTDEDRLACEAMTDIVETMARWYGYGSVLRQAIHHTLKYGTMFAFTREEWSREYHIFDRGNGPQKEKQKEGLRYIIPHPSQCYSTLKYPATSLNSDSGLDWMGHWHVADYGAILDNPNYWNRRKIFCGTNWFMSPLAGNFFQEVFPCSMKFPIATFGGYTREERAAWYTSSDRDKCVFLTEHYKKIIPKDWGLGNYRYPVWHRFTMAGDDTPVWVAPCGYTPGWFMGYDYDENAGHTASFALECIPWQDQLGNILSQMLLTARQNLMNVIFYDNQQVSKDDIERLKNLGEARYRGTNFIGFDSMRTRVAGLTAQNAFIPMNLSKVNIQELAQLLPITINIMERVLQISAQEAGTQGTHQQSKFELQQMGGASTNRVNFTCSYVDDGIDAWMQQLTDATQCYAEPSWVVNVSEDIPNLNEVLNKLGFTVVGQGEEHVSVNVNVKSLKLQSFARSARGMDLNTDQESAQAIMTCLGVIAQQPDLKSQIGPKNMLAMLEWAALLSGAPRGFRLKTVPEGEANQEVPPNILQAIQQAQQATMQAIGEKLGKPVAQEIGQVQQEVVQLQDVVKQLEGIYKAAQSAMEKNQAVVADAQQKMQIREQEFQQEQRRKEEKHQQDLRLAGEKATTDMGIKQAQAAVTMQQDEVKSEQDIKLAQQETDAKVDMQKKLASQKPKPATE